MFEKSPSSLKSTLSALIILALVVLAIAFFMQKGSTGDKAATTSKPTTATQTNLIPMTEAQKQFKAIQDQVNAGTLSTAEAKKQMDAIASKMAPPPIPPEIQKQIDAAKKAQQ